MAPGAFATAEAAKAWLSERFARDEDPAILLGAVATGLAVYLSADRIRYAELDAAGTTLSIALDWSPEGAGEGGRHPLDPYSPFARQCAAGTVMLAPAATDWRAGASALVDPAHRSAIAVPLLDDGRAVAVLAVSAASPRTWDDAAVALVAQTAARLWSALQHLRLTGELRASETQFRMMAENLPGICWVGDADARPIWGNGRWHAMYDGTAAAAGDSRDAIHPDDLPRARSMWREMRRDGVAGEYQLRLRGRDGVYRPFLSKAAPIRDAGGTVTRWVSVQIDLSDQQAQDRRQTVLRAIHDRTRDLDDPALVLRAVGTSLVEALGASHFGYYETGLSAAERAEQLRVSLGEDAAKIDLALADRVFAGMAAAGVGERTRVVNDNTQDHDRPSAAAQLVADRLGLRAGINAAIMRDGALVALLCLLDTSPRRWTDEDVALVEEVGERLWTLLARVRAERAVRERERAQAFLIAWTDRIRDLRSPDAIVATTLAELGREFGALRSTYAVSRDGDPRVFVIAGEWCASGAASIAHTRFSLDYAGEEFEREWLAGQILRYDDVAADPRVAATMRSIYAGADIRAFLTIPLIEQGRAQTALSVQSAVPRRWSDAEVQLLREVAERTWLAIERARAENDLQTRERNQAFLIDWTDRTRELTSVDAIVGATMRMLAAHLGVVRATYSVGDPTGRVFAICGEWADPRVISIANTSFSLDDVGSEVEREWTAGGIVRYDDIASDPRIEPEARGAYLATQIHAFVSIPLIEAGRVRSALSVQHDAPRGWRPDEIQLLREVADRTWVAIERARAEAELQARERAQAFLIDWTDRLRGERAPDRIVAITLERLGSHFGASRATYSLGDETGEQLINRGEWANGVVSVADQVWRLDDVDPDVRRDWLAGRPVHYDDIASDPRVTPARRAFFAGVSVNSLVTIPLIEDGRVRSALSLQSERARAWTDAEIQLLCDVAERTWVVLERARAEAELAVRERNQAFLIDWSDRIRGATDGAAIIAITLDALGPFLGVNRATFAALNPALPDTFEVTGEWRDGVDSLLGNRFTLPSVGAAVDRDWHAGESIRFDDVARDPRLEAAATDRYLSRDIAAFVSVPLVAGGAMQSALSVQSARARQWTDAEVQLLRDVAERTWVALERAGAQAQLAERSRHQAFLVAWSDAVRGEGNARRILLQTVTMLADHLSAARVNYAEPNADFSTMTVIEECNPGSIASAIGTTYRMADFGERLAAAQMSGRPVRIDDIATDPLLDEATRPLFQAINVGAALTLPMLRGREIMAVLSVQQDAPRRWTDGEVELVRELADRTLAVLERAQSEARLAESEAQLSAFMANAPVAMNLRDAQGRYIRLNPEFGRAVRRPVEELTGLTPADIFPPRVAAEVAAMHERALRGEVVSAELTEGHDDAYNSVLAITFPIGDRQGAAKTAGFTIDLSARRKAEAALQKSRDALHQSEKLTALGSLLAGVSHELNNPLSIVVAQAVMMERQSQGSEIAERAQKIRKAADRCARIVQSFLAMARQKRPERETVDLNAIATAAHELADYGLRNDGIRTVRDLAPNLPPILADSDQLHQIVINLIVNAQQAMAEAGVADRTLTLRSAVGDDPGTVVLEIADNGPGIPLEIQRRIFEPFYTTKPQGEGTGVGLSFSQGLAEAHGGTLELAPTPRGACFRLTLPIGTEAPAAAQAPELALAPSPPARRALVVDDEREIAESLADFLSLEGFACTIAIGGADAQTRLAAGDYDLIVSDLRMPGIDGPQLHAWVEAHRPELAPRMAFATGDTLGQTAARFLADSGRPVLEKPFTPEAVRRFLERLDLA